MPGISFAELGYRPVLTCLCTPAASRSIAANDTWVRLVMQSSTMTVAPDEVALFNYWGTVLSAKGFSQLDSLATFLAKGGWVTDLDISHADAKQVSVDDYYCSGYENHAVDMDTVVPAGAPPGFAVRCASPCSRAVQLQDQPCFQG